MRNVIPFVLAAFLGLGFMSAEQAEAGHRQCPRCQKVRRGHSPNVVQKLVDLERRKNAWLRRTFLGR